MSEHTVRALAALAGLSHTADIGDEHRDILRDLVASAKEEQDDLRTRLAAAEGRVERAEALAYIGEKRFPDLTYKARLEELVPDLRKAEKERDEMYEALEAIIQKAPASGPLWHGSEEIENACAALKKARGEK